MPKGPRGEKGPADLIGNAIHVMSIATGEILDPIETKKPHAAESARSYLRRLVGATSEPERPLVN